MQRMNLGGAANIDLAFSLPANPEYEYICVLEDDNCFIETHLSQNIEDMEAAGTDVSLRNALFRVVSGFV